MTGYVADLSWKSGVRNWKVRSTKVDAGDFKHELLNRLRSTMAVNVLISWNPLGHSRPVTGLLYLYFDIPPISKSGQVISCISFINLRPGINSLCFIYFPKPWTAPDSTQGKKLSPSYCAFSFLIYLIGCRNNTCLHNFHAQRLLIIVCHPPADTLPFNIDTYHYFRMWH